MQEPASAVVWESSARAFPHATTLGGPRQHAPRSATQRWRTPKPNPARALRLSGRTGVSCHWIWAACKTCFIAGQRAKKMLAESGENLSTAPRRIQSVCARPHASPKNPRPQPNTSYTTVYARKAPQGVPMQRRRVSRMLKPINPGLNRSFIVCAGRGVKGLVEFSIGVLLRITQVTAVVRTSTAPGTRSPRRVQ